MAKRKLVCRISKCKETPIIGGLCEKHLKERRTKDRRRSNALDLLRKFEVERECLTNEELKSELLKLSEWWERACSSINFDIADEILGDEAESATNWCISLAEEIYEAEMAYRENKEPDYSLEMTRQLVWQKFDNLEKGLRSNGLEK